LDIIFSFDFHSKTLKTVRQKMKGSREAPDAYHGSTEQPGGRSQVLGGKVESVGFEAWASAFLPKTFKPNT
jgi:hypothetical protein